MVKPQHYAEFGALDLAPVLVCERVGNGWRGLTADGELLNVQGKNGVVIDIPESLAVMRNGKMIGTRKVPTPHQDVIDFYQQHITASNLLARQNKHAEALVEIDAAIAIADTMLARYNRGMHLLALGQWREGLDTYACCEESSPLFMRPNFKAAIARGLRPWYGQDIAGRRLLLVHDHGFGDSIMCLRYLPILRRLGADVVLMMPQELERLARQMAPTTRELIDCDYFSPLLTLLSTLKQTPSIIPTAPYLKVDPEWVRKWTGPRAAARKLIGIAWSVGVSHQDDYPRQAPLEVFTQALRHKGLLASVQQNGEDEAHRLGVQHFGFEDFADCAAMMSTLDEIVTVDTAALHLAGAIGHPNVSAVLSHWHSWRWQAPWYPNVKFYRQESPGDWASAFAKMS